MPHPPPSASPSASPPVPRAPWARRLARDLLVGLGLAVAVVLLRSMAAGAAPGDGAQAGGSLPIPDHGPGIDLPVPGSERQAPIPRRPGPERRSALGLPAGTPAPTASAPHPRALSPVPAPPTAASAGERVEHALTDLLDGLAPSLDRLPTSSVDPSPATSAEPTGAAVGHAGARGSLLIGPAFDTDASHEVDPAGGPVVGAGPGSAPDLADLLAPVVELVEPVVRAVLDQALALVEPVVAVVAPVVVPVLRALGVPGPDRLVDLPSSRGHPSGQGTVAAAPDAPVATVALGVEATASTDLSRSPVPVASAPATLPASPGGAPFVGPDRDSPDPVPAPPAPGPYGPLPFGHGPGAGALLAILPTADAPSAGAAGLVAPGRDDATGATRTRPGYSPD